MLRSPPKAELMHDLFASREQYLTSGQVPSGVRPVVREAWERCRRYGIDPRHVRPQTLDPERLKQAQADNRLLLEAAEPFLQMIHQTLGEEPHLVAVSDAQGYILRLLADPVTEAAGGTAANLFAGASWHERDTGCNGIGTCLAAAQPIILIGPEHFVEAYVGWTCIGIPIKGADGSIVGALDFSVPNEHVQSHTWGWMLSIAQNIEQRLAGFDGNGSAKAAAQAIADPFNAVRGVLDLVASQSGLSPSHAQFVQEARQGVDAAAERLQTSVHQLLTAQQRLAAADRQKDEFLADRQRIEEQLRMTQFAMDRVSEAIYWIDPTSHFLYVNDAACQALGYSREELLGMSVGDIDPVFPVETWAEFWQQLRERRSHTLETVHRRKSGQTFPVEVSVNYQCYAGREYDFAIVRDITERKRVEAALRESENRFRVAIAATRALVYDIDLATNRVAGFDGLYELLGYRRDEVPISRDWWFAQMHPDEPFTTQQANADFQKADTYSKEYRIRHKDGHYLHVVDKGKVVQDKSGRPVRVIGSVTDITDRKRAEDQLRSSEEFQRRMLESSGDCIKVIDREGRLLSMNGTGQQLLEISDLRPFLQRSWIDLMEGDTREKALHAVAEASKGAIGKFQAYLPTLTGKPRWWDVLVTPIDDARGHADRLLVISRDITEQKKAEEQIQKAMAAAESANRAKDHFLAVLSHELRTPLTPVLTTVQMLERDRTLSIGLREAIQMIRRNVELETRLIDDLLDLTRISRGKLQLNVQNVDLHEKVYQVVSICESDIRAKQLGLTLHLNADRHHVHGDPARLQQVLWNLLKNSIKFTPFGGSISISTVNSDGTLTVAITDTGIGIEPDRLGRVFEAFEQGSTDVTRLFGGLGLGLSICKGLVDLHGGSISAASEGKDKGATFTVQLPVAAPSEPHAAPGESGQDAVSALYCRILLVEDHVDTAKAMRRLLSSFGCEVQVAGSVASALQMAQAEKFDLLISDLGLPDGSGHDLMRQLRARIPMKGIALSGYGTDEDVRKSIEAGFAAHLTKPVHMDRLEGLIRQLLL